MSRCIQLLRSVSMGEQLVPATVLHAEWAHPRSVFRQGAMKVMPHGRKT